MSKNYIIRSDYREKNSIDFGKSNIEETSFQSYQKMCLRIKELISFY